MKKVLVIEDNHILLRTISRVLSKLFDVTNCPGIGDANGLIDAGQRFDAIVCDMHLEDGTGQEFFEHLRTQSVEQSDRVLFMSGGEPDRDGAFFEATRGRHLEKPMLAKTLIEQILALTDGHAFAPA